MAADFAHPPEVVSARDGIELRRTRPEHAEAIAGAVAASLPELSHWQPWATPEAADAQAQRARLESMDEAWDAGTDYGYGAWLEGELVGCMGLHRRVGPGAIEIGYWLRTDVTGRGIATACARALTDAALSLADVERAYIHCDEANVRSAAIPARLGYRLDRIVEDDIAAPGEVRRSMVWIKSAD